MASEINKSSPNKRTSITKYGDNLNTQMDNDDQNSNQKKSRKNSNVYIKDISTFITSDNAEKTSRQDKDKDKQYLKDFNKFLNKKQVEKKRHSDYEDVIDIVQLKQAEDNQKHIQKTPNRQERIQNELKKRLKLYSKSKEAKFNDMLGVFKKLDTFIDIKPFLHDLNTVNNSRMYNTIQELKQRIAEKKNQEEVDVMLEQVKQKIQKQEKEQEEENKILSRGMKDFVQKTQLLNDTSKYIMDWRKNHNINHGIMSEQLIDHYRKKNNNYQELVDQNDPDIDAYQFYDQLSKQLFKQKSLFHKPNFSQIDTRRASIILRQEEANKKYGEEEIQQINNNENKRRRLQEEEEEITEEEKLRLAQENIKSKLLTIDGFEKENQDFADQKYFESFQEKAFQIRKNLQKATEATFKKKWANANMKLKKIKEDDYHRVMKQIKEAKKIKFENVQFPSRASFRQTFQGKEVHSLVSKMINSPIKERKGEDQEDAKSKQKTMHSIHNNLLNQVSRSNSNYSKESTLQKQLNYKSSRMASDISQQFDTKLFQDEDEDLDDSNSDESEGDSQESESGYFSKKWKQIQNDNRLSKRNSLASNYGNKQQLDRQLSKYSPKNSRGNSQNNSPPKQSHRFFFTQTSRNANESTQPSHKSQFHLMNISSSQSVLLNNQNLSQNERKQSFNQLLTSSTKAINPQNQYFFPSSSKNIKNNSLQNSKNQLYFQKPLQNITSSLTSRRNTDSKNLHVHTGASSHSMQDHSKSISRSARNVILNNSARNGIHPFIKKNNIGAPQQKLDIKISEFESNDQNEIYSSLESVGINNPPSTPSTRQINIDKSQYNKDLVRKQTESYQAVEKHLLGVKFQKFLKGIDHHQLKFGVTRERYQSKINQIQKKFENEITKYEPPQLDIYQAIEIEEDLNHKYNKGKMVNHRSLAYTLS